MIEKPKNCPGNHALSKYIVPEQQPFDYICDGCKTPIQKGENMYGCRECNFDLCEKCSEHIVQVAKFFVCCFKNSHLQFHIEAKKRFLKKNAKLMFQLFQKQRCVFKINNIL